VLVAYQKRKEAEVEHRVLQRKIPFGLVPTGEHSYWRGISMF
jgi:hypothetical protein